MSDFVRRWTDVIKTMGKPMITQYQRAEVVRLLRKLELDSVTVTYQHRTLGAPDYLIGRSVEGWLDTLTVSQTDSLIKRLRKDVDDAEDDA